MIPIQQRAHVYGYWNVYCAIIIVTIAHIAATFAVVRTMYMVNNDYDKFRSFSRLI